MPTYAEYVAEIEKLKELAEATRKEEIKQAREKIREIMTQNGLTAEDLVEKQATRAPKPVAARYRNPESGDTWSGRGRMPRWLSEETKEKYAIKD